MNLRAEYFEESPGSFTVTIPGHGVSIGQLSEESAKLHTDGYNATHGLERLTANELRDLRHKIKTKLRSYDMTNDFIKRIDGLLGA